MVRGVPPASEAYALAPATNSGWAERERATLAKWPTAPQVERRLHIYAVNFRGVPLPVDSKFLQGVLTQKISPCAQNCWRIT